MRLWFIPLVTLLTGCVGEWDIPKTPRRDPCTQVTEDKYVYVAPACYNPPPRNPHDLDYTPSTYR